MKTFFHFVKPPSRSYFNPHLNSSECSQKRKDKSNSIYFSILGHCQEYIDDTCTLDNGLIIRSISILIRGTSRWVSQNWNDKNTLHIEEKGYWLDALEVLEIARAKKNGKILLNEQLEFNISPLLKLQIEYN